jgi:hypothetical protein
VRVDARALGAWFSILMHLLLRSVFIASFSFVGPMITWADVPALARIKASAEAGNAEAQYAFANSFPVGSKEWTQWTKAAANQGLGPAEDAIAWTMNWAYLATDFTDPKLRSSHLKKHSAKMREALIFASSAADKAFSHSRLLLAYAYANGYCLPRDPIEAYKWVKLSRATDVVGSAQAASLKDKLLKQMPLHQVEAGEKRASEYRPGTTGVQIRNALVLPFLKLTGTVVDGSQRVAIVSGTRIEPGKPAQVVVEGISLSLRCIAIENKSVVVELLPDGTRVVLTTGSDARVEK